MNKKYLFGLIGLFAITLVSAGYLVNSFVITTDIYEPFNVQYAIMGDAGNYESGNCADATNWNDGVDVDVGGLYAGEARKICTKIVNLGEGDVSYTFSGEVTAGGDDCTSAFATTSVEGVAAGSDTSYNGAVINVADDAAPALDCQVTLSLTRG
jgi:hypothetical protein